MRKETLLTILSVHIRDATPEDAAALGRFIYMSGPRINQACFGPEAEDVLAELTRNADTIYGYRHARVADVDGRPAGAGVAFPGALQNSASAAYLRRLLAVAGPVGWCRAVARQFLLSRALLPKRADDLYLAHIAVDPDARCAGIGAALIRDLEETGRKRGARRLVLDVEIDNDRAAALYRRLGYVEEGRRSVRVGRRFTGSPGFVRMVKPIG